MEVNPYKLDGHMYIALKKKTYLFNFNLSRALGWVLGFKDKQDTESCFHGLCLTEDDREETWDMYGELWDHRMGLPNRNGGVDAGFLEPVKFELKHKGRKRFSQARDTVEGGQAEESLLAVSKVKHGHLATTLYA